MAHRVLMELFPRPDDTPEYVWNEMNTGGSPSRVMSAGGQEYFNDIWPIVIKDIENELDNAEIHIKRAKKISNNSILLNKLSDLEYQIKKKRIK